MGKPSKKKQAKMARRMELFQKAVAKGQQPKGQRLESLLDPTSAANKSVRANAPQTRKVPIGGFIASTEGQIRAAEHREESARALQSYLQQQALQQFLAQQHGLQNLDLDAEPPTAPTVTETDEVCVVGADTPSIALEPTEPTPPPTVDEVVEVTVTKEEAKTWTWTPSTPLS